MTKMLLISVLLLTVAFKTPAQKSYAVKGIVRDTVAGIFLENLVIKILNKNDSTLINFSRAKSDGSFLIGNLAFGNYLFIVSYPKYIDFVQPIIIDSTRTSINIGMIKIVLLPVLLQEVKIVNNNKIIIKGDTIEYNAKSFVIQPNSKVESLLAQLPGLQIDKDGKITAQGQVVNKLLLDGEEFLSDDITLINRNIRGDM